VAVVVSWKRVLIIVGIVLGVVILAVGVAYAADAPLDATIKQKNCTASQPTVTIVTDLFGITHALKMTHDKCSAIQNGNYVRYHLRSEHTQIYSTKGGACVFDSVTIACAAGT